MTDSDRLPALALTERIAGVEVFRWMPRRFSALPEYQPENFGDSLAREIVAGMVAENAPLDLPQRSRRLLSIGSILHFARDADTVWGSGINGKVDEPLGSVNIDVRAVRGPKTRAALQERGVAVPAIYGDPGLLLPELFPVTRQWAQRKRHKVAIVPNFNDADAYAALPDFVNPLAPLWDVIRRIAQSEYVIASSLHGIIVAEALGVPVRPLRSAAESTFKYDDYAQGTGRQTLETAATIAEAMAAGPIEPLQFDTTALRAAFPADLWQNFAHTYILETGAASNPELLSEALSLTESQDELVLSLSDTSDATMEPLRELAADRDNVRLIGTPQETRGARLNAALAWARGATVSFIGRDEQRVAGSIDTARDALATAGAALAFTRVQEYDLGPDRYAWAGAPADEAVPLASRPDLLTFEHPSGVVLDADACRSGNWRFADRDSNVLLAPLVIASQSDLPVVALDTVSTLHRRPEHPPADDLVDALEYFGRVLDLTKRHDARMAVVSLISAAWLRAESGADEAAVGRGAEAILDRLPSRPAATEKRRTVGLLRLAALGYADLANLGFGTKATIPSVDRFAAAARTLNHAAGSRGTADAALTLLTLAVRITRGITRTQLDTLRMSILDLDLVLRPDSKGKRDEGCMPGIFAAALQSDNASLALLLAEPGDAQIDKAVQTPVGWAVSGTVAATLADPSIRVWVDDSATGSKRIVGRLLFGQSTGGRTAFTGVIRSIGAPAGMLVLRPKEGGPSLGITTARRSAGKFVHQMLHPIELPLDGGQALLVRRTLPTNAVRARARQQA